MDNLITLWISAASAQLDKLDLSEEQNDAIVELFDLCSENAEKALKLFVKYCGANHVRILLAI
jgi:hypothetical protein